LSGNAARPELLPLKVIFGQMRLDTVGFSPPLGMNIISPAHRVLLISCHAVAGRLNRAQHSMKSPRSVRRSIKTMMSPAALPGAGALRAVKRSRRGADDGKLR
jgi:hypothetical protein